MDPSPEQYSNADGAEKEAQEDRDDSSISPSTAGAPFKKPRGRPKAPRTTEENNERRKAQLRAAQLNLRRRREAKTATLEARIAELEGSLRGIDIGLKNIGDKYGAKSPELVNELIGIVGKQSQGMVGGTKLALQYQASEEEDIAMDEAEEATCPPAGLSIRQISIPSSEEQDRKESIQSSSSGTYDLPSCLSREAANVHAPETYAVRLVTEQQGADSPRDLLKRLKSPESQPKPWDPDVEFHGDETQSYMLDCLDLCRPDVPPMSTGLGEGDMDPFDVMPVAMSQRNRALINHCTYLCSWYKRSYLFLYALKWHVLC
jgi:hypothetical protein